MIHRYHLTPFSLEQGSDLKKHIFAFRQSKARQSANCALLCFAFYFHKLWCFFATCFLKIYLKWSRFASKKGEEKTKLKDQHFCSAR